MIHGDRLIQTFAGLIAMQVLCAGFFIGDIYDDLIRHGEPSISFHLVMELSATILLVAAIAVEVRVMLRLHRRHARLEHNLRAASGALGELIEDHIRNWELSPAEADVARFTIKGYSIAEIAELRGAREGTVKTQLNAIYRKSGANGRMQLVSILVDDLLTGALVGEGDEENAGGGIWISPRSSGNGASGQGG